GAPPPIDGLQPLTPAPLQRLVSKCLEKDPDERWQSAKDIADELRWIGSVTTQQVERRSSLWPWAITALAAAIAAVLAARLTMSSRKTDSPIRLEFTPPGSA